MPPGAHRGGTKSDLARFTRLGSTGGEYMLYATSLGSGLILALAFDAETPFSKIRSQANQLARELAAPPAAMLAQTVKAEKTVSPPVERKLFQSPPASPALRKPVHAIPDLSENWLNMDSLAKSLLTEAEQEEAENEVEPARPLAEQDTKPVEKPEVNAPAQTVPTWDTIHGDVINPVAPGMVYLVYACVVIPRLPQHHLAGDLVERLMEWIGQLCLAFGWRLEYISVAAEYAQWVVNVPPTTSPSYLMRILRQHTSKRIFADFPDLARDNPSGDFWAHGYLIMSSPTPPPEQTVRDFIQQIRRHQGAFNSFPPHLER